MAAVVHVGAVYDGRDIDKAMTQLKTLEKQVKGTGSRAGKGFGKLGGAAKTAFAGFAGGMVVGQVANQFMTLAQAGQESVAATKTTEQIIKSTGGTALVTAQQVGDLADALSRKTGIDDEQIQSASNLLLTFKNVKNAGAGQAAMFDRATAAALDLSKAGFGSTSSTAKMLGKALNDPLKGLTALGKAGVTFTADQKKQIKALVDKGDTLKAQQLIMAEVESQVGGVAAATASPIEKLQTAIGNLQEKFGAKLLPLIDKMATKLIEFTDWAQKNAGTLKTWGMVLGSIAVAFVAMRVGLAAYNTVVGTFRAITMVATAAQWAMNVALAANPIGIVVIAIAALVAGFVLLYKKNKTFANFVNTVFKGLGKVFGWVFGLVKKGLGTWIKAMSVVVPWVLRNFYKPIVNAFLSLAENITGLAAKAFGWVPGIGDKLKGAHEAVAGFKTRMVDGMGKVADAIEKKGGEIGDKLMGTTTDEMGKKTHEAAAEKAGAGLLERARKGMARAAEARDRKAPGDVIAGRARKQLESPKHRKAMEDAGARLIVATNKGMASETQRSQGTREKLLTGIRDTLHKSLTGRTLLKFGKAGANLVGTFQAGYGRKIGPAVTTMKDRTVKLLDGVRDRLGRMRSAFSKTGASIVVGLASGFVSKAKSRLAGIADVVMGRFKSLYDKLWRFGAAIKGAGRHLIDSLRNGIKDAWNAAKETLSGIWKFVTDWLAKLKPAAKASPAARSSVASVPAGRSLASSSLAPAGAVSLSRQVSVSTGGVSVAPGGIVVNLSGVPAGSAAATRQVVDEAVGAALAQLSRQVSVSSRSRVVA